jgi:adenylosuccinate lyase
MRKCPLTPKQGARMHLTPLTALSSVDGRYAAKTDSLRPICSEYGLIRRRLFIEIRWFEALAAHAGIPDLPSLGTAARNFLDALVAGFDEAAAARIRNSRRTPSSCISPAPPRTSTTSPTR